MKPITTATRIADLRTQSRDEFWSMAEWLGKAASERDQRAQQRRDRSPKMVEFYRLCRESIAANGGAE